jgi:hypothetical protein
MDNKVSIAIPSADLAATNDALAVIKATLGQFLISLSKDERKGLTKMGELSRAFVEKFLDYARTNPQYLPPFQNMEELQKDWSAIVQLLPIYNQLRQLVSDMGDTLMQAGAELMEPANLYYGTVGLGAKAGLPGAKPIHDDMKTRYVRKKKKVED